MNVFMRYVRAFAKHLILIALAVVVAYTGKSFSCSQVDASFKGMLPDVENGETLLIDRRPARTGEFRPGDAICFTFACGSDLLTWAGRVAAVPGQTFEVKDNSLIVNGKRYKSQHAPSVEKFNVPPVMVPRGHLLVTFNARPNGVKRLEQHLVPLSAVRGRIIR